MNSDVEVEGLFQKGYWVEDARIVWENESESSRSAFTATT